MGSRYLTDLADVCRAAGLVVHEEPGWQTRARGSGGYNSGAPNHIMCHHTASNTSPANDVSYMCHGSENAPIANLYLARDGAVTVMAAGATNTNGSGRDPCGLIPADSMNSNAIGIEAANVGTGEPWPEVQQSRYTTLVNALCSHYGIGVPQVHSHHEYTLSDPNNPAGSARKIDPAGPAQWPPVNSSQTWDMNAFRVDLGHDLPPPQPPPGDDDMPLAFYAYADGTGLILVAIDGAGHSITPMITETDRAAIDDAIGPLRTAHVTKPMFDELYRIAGAGETS